MSRRLRLVPQGIIARLVLQPQAEFEEAADWGVKAAARPNAHAHILAIAAYSLALAGRSDDARAYVAYIRKTRPHNGIDDFLTAIQFGLKREDAKRRGSPKTARHLNLSFCPLRVFAPSRLNLINI